MEFGAYEMGGSAGATKSFFAANLFCRPLSRARQMLPCFDLGFTPQALCLRRSAGYIEATVQLFPARVRALILADTRAQADTEEAKRTRAQQAEKALAEGMAGMADAMLPKLLTPETVSKRPEIVKRVRDMMLKTKPEGAAAALQGMAERDDQTPLLPNISVPALILVGAEDALTPVADSEKMQQSIPGSRLVVLENAGHVSNLERTEQFNDALLSFLRESLD
jgi:pimeloyl-ACP methyl ester carboxylesterase